MNKIITYLVQKPRTVDVLIALIVLVGLMSLLNMRSNFLPSEPVNFINISAVYRGASPQEVEEEVINKIEDNLDGLKGIERVTSTAQESFGVVRVELKEQADRNEVLQDINNAVDKINTFPLGVETPIIQKEEPLNYTMTFGIVGEVELSTLKDYAKVIKDELLLKPQISQVYLSGFPEEEIEVRLNESDLRAYKLTFDEVAEAINLSNLKASGGEIETGTENILIRLNHRSYYANELLNTVIKATPDGKVVLLKNIAEVEDRFADKPNRSFVNGKPAAILKVFSRSEEDILENATLVADYIQQFNQENTMVEAVIIEDKSVGLNEAISNLVNNAWQGILLVLIILGLFLHPSIAFWVAFKIPVALLGMFILSNFYDLTINQVSLFGTILVLGILVDDGVVVAENIYQHFQSGKKPLQSAIDGTLEVLPSVFSALATTAVAFALFFFLDGQLGDFFSDISFVVCATLLVALLESMFILPVHIARSKALKKDGKTWKITQFTNRSLLFVRDRFYAKLIHVSLRFPIVSVMIVFLVMFLTVVAMSSGLIKGTFFPNIDQDVITAQLELPLGVDESILAEKLEKMEEAVWEVNQFYTKNRTDGKQVINYVERVIGPNSNEGRLNIYMLDGDNRGIQSFEIASKVREKVGPIPEARNLSYGSIAIFGKPVSIALIGNNLKDLRGAKLMLRDYLASRDDLKDITDTDKQGMPEIEVNLTPKARLLGLSEAVVFNQIRKGFFGLEAQSLQRGDEEIKVWLRYNKTDRKSIENLANIRLLTPDGASYPMNELATFKRSKNVTEINHQNNTREIRVEADIENLLVSVPAVLADAEATILKDIKETFPNVRYTLEGEARLSAKTQNSSQNPSLIVLLLMVGILLLNYRSLSKAVAILAMLPFAFVGVAWGTYLHNIPISIFSILGMIALWGILINNGLVLISTYNDNIKEGMSVKDALKDAAISRFRPIILTTLTTVFGLGPLLLNNSLSAQFIKPTAIAVGYGLIFGIFLTLLFLPSLIIILNGIKLIIYRIWTRSKNIKPEEIDITLKEIKNEIA